MSEYLPVEVMVEILKRLPVKSVVKCKSVCKSWNNLIKTPSFISTHLQTSLSKPHNQLLLLEKFRVRNGKEPISLHVDNDDFDEFKQLHFPAVVAKGRSPYFNVGHVGGSCNGLVCLLYSQSPNIYDFIFWNPSIQKYITLPRTSITGLTKNGFLIFGFGFDSRTNNYKLLKVVFEEGETSMKAYLFSLNENSWKRVTASFPQHVTEIQTSSFLFGIVQNSTFINGAFHWLGLQSKQDGQWVTVIYGFDVSTENYFAITLPEFLLGWGLSIMKYEESSIAVSRKDFRCDIDMWVMKKYGVDGSWTKLLHLIDQSGRSPVLGFRKNGEVLLEIDCGQMVSLDLNSQQLKHLGIEAEEGDLLISLYSYVESLVLLDKGLDASSVSYAKHANESGGSIHHIEEESEMA